MIKGRLPYPFETIGLAVSFSHGLPRLVAEMKRLAGLHDAMSVFIHAGKKTSEKQRALSQLLSSYGFNDNNSRVYWDPGETVSTILRICKHEVVDLLLIGASEREDFRLPIGQTAHAIALKAKCSLLIYTGAHKGNFQRLVVNGTEHRKTDKTIQTAVYFAGKENSESINVMDDNVDVQDESEIVEATQTINQTLEKPAIKLGSIQLSRDHSVTETAAKNNADLLVTYSSDHHLMIFDRISSKNGLDSMLKSMPCSMLIVHSRIRD